MFKAKPILFFTLLFPLLMLAHEGENEEHIIRMTDQGFEPSEITIMAGEEVVFVNDDSSAHWPAADFHPTHGLYPAFDPQKGIEPGDYWKFKFEKTGLWRMHDHLVPHFTGTITVNEAELEETPANAGFWQKLKDFLRRIFG